MSFFVTFLVNGITFLNSNLDDVIYKKKSHEM